MQIAEDGLLMLNNILNALSCKLSESARSLTVNAGKRTVTGRMVAGAVDLILPGTLNGAKGSARRAVSIYTQSLAIPMSRSKRSGLEFGVPLSEKSLRDYHSRVGKSSSLRISADAPLYHAAILQWIGEEILELAGIVAKDNNMTRISARHIYLAIVTDVDLDKLMDVLGIQLDAGNATPDIHPIYLKKN